MAQHFCIRVKCETNQTEKYGSNSCPPKSLYISRSLSNFYGTGFEIWTGFGLVGSTENKIWAYYEQLLRGFFSCFHGQKFFHFWKNIVEGGASNSQLINGCFMTISSQIFAIYIHIFHKTEVQMVVLRCLTGLNCNWFKSYDAKHKYFHFQFFAIL